MRLLLLLTSFLFVPTVLAERPSDLDVLKIQTVASCVDDVFYQAGYEDGDTSRIELIDTMLMLLNLPAYDEEYLYLDVTYDGKVSSEVYYQCISGERELLDEAAQSLGVVAN
jgi:hypothetical protein|tara:strand:- start:375 stop:710 length:336 start_codon:yes stop_codon:yes gene_type:complete